jgi:hypothetical protein
MSELKGLETSEILEDGLEAESWCTIRQISKPPSHKEGNLVRMTPLAIAERPPTVGRNQSTAQWAQQLTNLPFDILRGFPLLSLDHLGLFGYSRSILQRLLRYRCPANWVPGENGRSNDVSASVKGSVQTASSTG